MSTAIVGAVGLAWALSLAGTGFWFYEAGRDSELATQYREETAAAKATKAATDAAASEISKIEVQRGQIIQPTITTVREVVRYRECKHDPGVLRNINAALTGEPERPGRGQLPAPRPADR